MSYGVSINVSFQVINTVVQFGLCVDLSTMEHNFLFFPDCHSSLEPDIVFRNRYCLEHLSLFIGRLCSNEYVIGTICIDLF